jgi:hypothetical protein
MLQRGFDNCFNDLKSTRINSMLKVLKTVSIPNGDEDDSFLGYSAM